MWLLLWLLIVPVIARRMNLCSTNVDIICTPPNNKPDIVPGTERELHTLCPLVLDHLECLHSYDLACAGRSEYVGLAPPMYYNRIRAFMDQACEERTSLHKALRRTLPCIKSRMAISDLICKKDREKVLKAYEDYFDSTPVARGRAKGAQGKKLRKDCLHDVFTTACVLENVEKECGFLAHEAGTTAVKQTQILADKCGLDVFQDLAQAVTKFRLEENLRDLLQEYFVVEIQ